MPAARMSGRAPFIHALAPLALAAHVAVLGAAAALAGWVPAAHAQAAGQQAAREYDIPAGPLSAALLRFSSEAGIFLAGATEQARGKASPGLRGRHTVQSGLATLLAGTGLEARRQADGSYGLQATAASAFTTAADPAATGGAGQGNTLAPVTVTAPSEVPGALPRAHAGGQVARGAPVGMLGTQNVMDTPFSVTSYTSELIENQQARSLGDVLVSDPGVRMSSPPGGQYQDFTVRGFYQDSIAFNGLQGAFFSTDAVPTEIIERVNVIKGPTTLISGMSPAGRVGGLIDIQTKRAGDEPLTRLSVDYQTESQRGGHIDVGRRFGADGQLGVRVNAAYREGDTALDHNARRVALGSAGLDWRGDRLRASIDLVSQRGATSGFPRYIGFADGVVPKAPASRLNPFNGSRYTMDSDMVLGRIEYDLAPDWTLYAAGGRSSVESTFLGINSISGAKADGSFSAPVMTGLNTKDGGVVDVGLRGRFRTGAVTHSLSVAGNHTRTWLGSNYITRATTIASNLYDPVRVHFTDSLPETVWTTSRTTLDSLAIADTLGLMDERLLLTLGLRHQKVASVNLNQAGARTASYGESAVTPMLGVVFKLRPDVSLYANYIEGLSAGSTVNDATAANNGATMPPYRTKQVEAGVKWDLGTLTHTLGLFQITRPSLIKDPVTTVYSADGEQRNRGLEWQVFGELRPGLRLLGGASYIQAKTVRSAGGVFDGKDVFGVARRQATLGAEWDVPAVPGLSVNARLTHTGRLPLDSANAYRIPSWTRYDAGARYATRLGGRPVTVRFNVENLFNRSHWIGQTFLSGFAVKSAPRTLMLSATFDL